jgi:hypothetical protein
MKHCPNAHRILLCGRCYDEVTELFESPCDEKPEHTHGAIGMYHCPDCGAMLLAGMEHFQVCARCRDRQHPAFDTMV